MPFYDYKCVSCDYEWNELRKISEMHIPMALPCKKCGKEGHIERRLYGSSSPLVDPSKLGLVKPDQGFVDVLRKIHDRTPGSRLKDTSNISQL